MTTELGFVVTPGEIESRIAALNASIQALAQAVAASKAPKLDKLWRFEFDAFVRRWAVERDSYADWSARLFATRVMPRLDTFEASYRAWARQYQQRTSSAPPVPNAAPSKGFSDSVIPREAWWLLGGVAALLVFTRR